MKKLLLISSLFFSAIFSVVAQWTDGGAQTSTPDNVQISNTVAAGEVKLEVKNSSATGFSVIRFSDVASDKAYIHRFNSSYVSPNATKMWEANSIGFYESVGSMNIGGASAFKVFTGNANSERFRIDETGKIGVGTSTPSELLQLGSVMNQNKYKLFIPGQYNFEGVRLGQYGNGACGLEFINHGGVSNSYGVRLYSNIDDGLKGLQIQIADLATDYTSLSYSTKMTVLSNGNVGIGRTPQSKLHISSGNDGDAVLIVEADSDNNNENDNSRIELVQDGGTLKTYMGFNSEWGSDNLFSIGSLFGGVNHYNNLVINPETGNVGIGTTTTGDKLTVNGSFKAQNGENYFRYSGTADLWLKSAERGNGGRAIVHDENNILVLNYAGDFTGGTRIGSHSSKVFFTNNGDVGFGTNTPNSKLHVVAPVIDESNTTSNSATLVLEGTSTTRTVGQGASLGFNVTAYADGSNPRQQGRILVTPDNDLNQNASGRMYIQTRYLNAGAWDWRNNLVLLSNGYVGIGTSQPKYMLDVLGTIRAEEVIVNLDGLADYVFEPTYNLKPLAEVEKFVKEEKHLPEMPSAAEVADKGMNMGKMQNLLLQKVEELTLYLIEQQKVMQLQQAQIDELKKQVAEKNMATK